jgi:hypothetical protein
MTAAIQEQMQQGDTHAVSTEQRAEDARSGHCRRPPAAGLAGEKKKLVAGEDGLCSTCTVLIRSRATDGLF